LPDVQLFDLAADPAESRNMQGQYPEIVARLSRLLQSFVAEGRSTPGPRMKNARDVDVKQGIKIARAREEE
jgi:hypothetical protein